jgi:hypothetical protein
MNKEQQELLNEVYRHYLMEDAKILPNMSKEKMTELGYGLTQEEFINKCKTDQEFSDKWGLKIEERELSLEERCSLANFAPFDDRFPDGDDFKWDEHTINIAEDWLKQHHPNLPTKLITITYNDKTIENYE